MEDLERSAWNAWNTSAGARQDDGGVGIVAEDEARHVMAWLGGRRGLRILDAGCGTGWMSARLATAGDVVGTDLADEVIEQARRRLPQARFVAGDIMDVDVGGDFDVVVSLEVLSHVADQQAFIQRLHDVLRPGGELMLATQNRPVLARLNRLPEPPAGMRRRWVNRRELRAFLASAGFGSIEIRTITPLSDHGPARIAAAVARRVGATPLLERAGFGWTLMVRAVRPI
ncbi:MAG: class I SAM-dependent methyltransferase [Thermoleophilia bacterium]